jgi:hypothetical protein
LFYHRAPQQTITYLSATHHLRHEPYTTINKMAAQAVMIDPTIFEGLQTKIDEDTAIRDVSTSTCTLQLPKLHVTAY